MKRIFYILPLLLLLHSCKNALVLDIKTISFDKEDTISFGNNQDIIISGLPDSTLSIEYTKADSTFSWRLNKPAYFKINGATQNSVLLDSIRRIAIGNNLTFEIKNIEEITQTFTDEKDGVKYIKLNSLIKAAFKTTSPLLDTLNSIVACDNNNDDVQPKLIILDRNVVAIKVNGERQEFKTSSIVDSNKISIEFFRTFNSVLLDSTKIKLFYIGDTVFYTTVKSYYTPFGASKINIEANERLDVSFNRFFRAVIPNLSIDSAFSKNNSIAVSIKQKVQSNTYSNEIYTTNISNSNEIEFGTVDTSLNFIQTKENTLLNENNFKSFRIDKQTFFVSTLPLILIFIFGLVVIFFVTKNDLFESQSNQGESPKWRKYFWLLFSLLFILSIGRIFIGYNLSFTPPYYSFTFPTSIIVSPLILLTVLYIWLIFILHDNIEAVGFWYRLALVFGSVLLMLSLQKITSHYFQFYYSEFQLALKEVKILHPIDSIRKIMKWEIYYQTLFSLLFFLSCLSLSLLFVKFSKTILVVCSALLCFIFFFQKSSYSVAALLIVLALITFIATALTRYVKLNHKTKFSLRIGRYFLLVMPSILVFIFIASLLKHDSGYFINLLLFPLILSIILFRFYKYYPDADLQIDKQKTKQQLIWSILSISIIIIATLSVTWYLSQNYNPLEKTRMGSRFTSFYHFNTVHEYGTRESEKQAQFFAELSKYTYPSQHNQYEPIHPGICSFIDPVVKNDLSAPFGLIYQFGESWWLIPIFTLLFIWCSILIAVLWMTITPTANSDKQRHFTQCGIIRIYCACMIVSSGLWLIASYYNIVPFTGRLIFGLGQDSIAEVFETIFLFSYIGLISKTES